MHELTPELVACSDASGRAGGGGSTARQRRTPAEGIGEGGVDVASRCHPAGSGVVVGSGSPVDSLERRKVAGGHANGGAAMATTLGGGADKVSGEVVGEEEKISRGMTRSRGLALIPSVV